MFFVRFIYMYSIHTVFILKSATFFYFVKARIQVEWYFLFIIFNDFHLILQLAEFLTIRCFPFTFFPLKIL